MKLGIAVSLNSAGLVGNEPLESLLHAVDEGGFDALWSLENPLADQPDPLVWLTAAAVQRPQLTIGTAALIAPLREPVLLARQLATVDRLTNGRLLAGFAVGRRQEDYELTGLDFGARGRLLEDNVAVVRHVMSGLPFNFAGSTGNWHSSTPVGLRPATVGGPPIVIGGQADLALKRAVSIGDGYLGGATSGPVHAVAASMRLTELLEEAGRRDQPFLRVTNLFVQLGTDAATAMAQATTTLQARHSGHLAYDPAQVVVAGPAENIAQQVLDLGRAGYTNVNLVPVTMDLGQVAALRAVVEIVGRETST